MGSCATKPVEGEPQLLKPTTIRSETVVPPVAATPDPEAGAGATLKEEAGMAEGGVDFFTVLMPVSAALSFVALAIWGIRTSFVVASFFWLWSVKNHVLASMGKAAMFMDFDGGLLTFATYVVVFALTRSRLARGGVALLVAINHAGPALITLPRTHLEIAAVMRKPYVWARVWRVYVAIMAVYWVVVGALWLARPHD
jgi:hypothetical protein